MKKTKVCPLFVVGYYAGAGRVQLPCDCLKQTCALWIKGHTVKGEVKECDYKIKGHCGLLK